MSAGDIDDDVIPLEAVNKLRKRFQELDNYLKLAWTFHPFRSFFIPYGAGISEDGMRVYISHDIQTVVSGIECENALIRHETTEWGLREFCSIGIDYAADPNGHRMANVVEFARVYELVDRPNAIELYEGILDPQVILAERTKVKGKPVPRDLALYPYEDDEKLLYDLKDEMWSQISIDEWCRHHPEDIFDANKSRQA